MQARANDAVHVIFGALVLLAYGDGGAATKRAGLQFTGAKAHSSVCFGNYVVGFIHGSNGGRPMSLEDSERNFDSAISKTKESAKSTRRTA